ncbi:AMP-binding protein [Sphingobacterium anhuiense]|uniref:AMP-binding protein n=1 Tax=Sphingobacterium anhuiense TaxID=493780 RepID=A0ABW5YUY8_9SPHI
MRLRQKIDFAIQVFKSLLYTLQSGINLFTLLKSIRKAKDSYLNDGNRTITYAALYDETCLTIEKLKIVPKNKLSTRVILIADSSFNFISYLFALSALSKEVIIMSSQLSDLQLEKILENYPQVLMLTDNKDRLENLRTKSLIYSFAEINACVINKVSHKIRRNNGKITILSTGSSNIPKPIERKLNISKIWSPFTELISKLGLFNYSSTFITVPFYHGYGLASLILALFLKHNLHFTTKFSAKCITQFTNNRIDCLVLLPSMIPKFIKIDQNALGLFRCIISGADKLEATWVSFILNQYTETNIYNLYGTTELGICSIATHTDLTNNNNTIGRFLKGIEYHLQADQQLKIRCPWIHDQSKNQYVITGDRIHQDKNGFLYYLGRTNSSFNIGGEIIHFSELEEKINSYESVAKTRILVSKNEMMISELNLELTLKKDSAFNEAEFRKWLNRTFPKYLQPKSLHYNDN